MHKERSDVCVVTAYRRSLGTIVLSAAASFLRSTGRNTRDLHLFVNIEADSLLTNG